MEHITRKTCFSQGMWLAFLAILVVHLCSANLQPQTHRNITNSTTTTTTERQLSSASTESPGNSESPKSSEDYNLTHSYTEEPTAFERSNTTLTGIYSNTIDDQQLEVTSSFKNSGCALCPELEYNSTEIINSTKNSSEYIISEVTAEGYGFFNTGIILAISALVVVILALIGGLGFFAYRHFAWNRPQTLTDKFSNDESTGYIDDSAFRENSEEMYSLDNDSFLNSLEAMTIQNYWTDHNNRS